MSTKLMLIVCLFLVGLFNDVSSETCTFIFYRQVKTEIRCGRFGWQICTQYKTVSSTGTRPCNMTTTTSIPINGGWTEFEETEITECSASCGNGTQYRTLTRNCTNPAPSNGGSDCEGNATRIEIIYCNSQTCPVNGGWTEYQETGNRTECSTSCGTGTQIRTLSRNCTNPVPSGGGLDCEGDSTITEMVNCTGEPCPVHGGWSDWSEWEEYDECSALCGTGKMDQWRTRTCNNPAPAFGGADCIDVSLENRTVECNTDDCGDLCPLNAVKYFPHPNNTKRFYQCDNGVAKLRNCAPSTVWSQAVLTCIHPCVPDDDCSNGKPLTADPTDCTKFYYCNFGERCGSAVSCALGLVFNRATTNCDFPYNVPGCGSR
ncbi:coadhesin isoform X1 [Patella vulgata]|uniref:coadhesin isoform X1 n=1 Tax=Patella vulgata TaxID=6465 RepID=UPI00217FCC54|nr:coadhesin isoform X1 [Patella vulgata]